MVARACARARQSVMKCDGVSGACSQSLQVGPSVLPRKRLASACRPSHPTRRRTLKLFSLVSLVLLEVELQRVDGLPSGMSHSLMW